MAKNMNILTPQHPLWDVFAKRLDIALQARTCDDLPDRPLTRVILTELAKLSQTADINVAATLDWYTSLDGYCDCEVLYHVVGKYEMVMGWHQNN